MPDKQQSSQCLHQDFNSSVFINRTIDEATGEVVGITADVVIVCKQCGRRFYPQSMNEFGHIVLFSVE